MHNRVNLILHGPESQIKVCFQGREPVQHVNILRAVYSMLGRGLSHTTVPIPPVTGGVATGPITLVGPSAGAAGLAVEH